MSKYRPTQNEMRQDNFFRKTIFCGGQGSLKLRLSVEIETFRTSRSLRNSDEASLSKIDTVEREIYNEI